jgi:hypothetical protein
VYCTFVHAIVRFVAINNNNIETSIRGAQNENSSSLFSFISACKNICISIGVREREKKCERVCVSRVYVLRGRKQGKVVCEGNRAGLLVIIESCSWLKTR